MNANFHRDLPVAPRRLLVGRPALFRCNQRDENDWHRPGLAAPTDWVRQARMDMNISARTDLVIFVSDDVRRTQAGHGSDTKSCPAGHANRRFEASSAGLRVRTSGRTSLGNALSSCDKSVYIRFGPQGSRGCVRTRPFLRTDLPGIRAYPHGIGSAERGGAEGRRIRREFVL